MTNKPSGPELTAELEDLRARLAEAEDVLRAIRNGEVDAVVVTGERGEQVYTLSGADRVYRQLIETMSEGAVTLSADGVILYCNVCLAKMLGLLLDQVLGTALRNYLSPADQQALDAILAQARTSPSRREINLKTSEGRLVPVYLSASRLQSEGAEMVFCLVLTDLTEQKSKEQIVAAERLARLILGQAAEAIVVCDEQGRVTRTSQAAQRFYDGSPFLRPFGEVFPLRIDASDPFYLAPVLRGETLRNVDVTLDRQGQKFDLILTAGPLLSDQQILGCVVTLTDITERKKLEAQFIQAHKMESVGRLAGGVAHDFNNMLCVILGHAQLCLDTVDPALPLHEDLEEILKAARRSADLTRQLLTFARKQPAAPKVLDLNETVEGRLKMLRRLVGEDIDVAWVPGQGLWPVRIDPAQIDQILANLAVNARDAIAGTGKVTIETENVVFDEPYCASHVGMVAGEYAMFALSDDGCGMEKDVVDHLFDPFFTTKAVGNGTGLGLATVFGIVKQNEGFINVFSEPGKGSTFKIYLLRHEGRADTLSSDEAVAPPRGGTETVLLVEDETAILQLGKRLLERLGYTVLTASAPGEAIRIAEQRAGVIHALITDVVMPEMSGRELADRLSSSRPNLKLLFMSGYTDNVIAHHGVLDEGVHFLPKPFSLRDMAAKVREAIEGE